MPCHPERVSAANESTDPRAPRRRAKCSVFPSNFVPIWSTDRDSTVTLESIDRSALSAQRESHKPFVAQEFSMSSINWNRRTPVISGQLSTQAGSFSTQASARIHLRDVDFVSPYSTGSYLTTGVETRTPVECRPCASMSKTVDCV